MSCRYYNKIVLNSLVGFKRWGQSCALRLFWSFGADFFGVYGDLVTRLSILRNIENDMIVVMLTIFLCRWHSRENRRLWNWQWMCTHRYRLRCWFVRIRFRWRRFCWLWKQLWWEFRRGSLRRSSYHSWRKHSSDSNLHDSVQSIWGSTSRSSAIGSHFLYYSE